MHTETSIFINFVEKKSFLLKCEASFKIFAIFRFFKSATNQKQSAKSLLNENVLKICSKFTAEHPCRSTISIKLLCNFFKIALQHGYSPVNLLHIFRTTFSKNTSGWLLLSFYYLQKLVRSGNKNSRDGNGHFNNLV